MAANPELMPTNYESLAESKSTELTTQANGWISIANDLEVDSYDMAEIAANQLKEVKAQFNTIEAERKAIVGPINDSVKRINTLFKLATGPCQEAEKIIKGKILTFNQEQDRIRREQEEKQRRLQEEARRKAEEERQAAAAKAAEAAKAGDEKAAAEAQEQAEEAEAKTEALQHAAPVAVAEKKVTGVSTRKNWKAEVTDLMELVKAVADGKVPLNCIQANQTQLNKMAKAMESEMNYPGVRAYNDEVIASR